MTPISIIVWVTHPRYLFIGRLLLRQADLVATLYLATVSPTTP